MRLHVPATQNLQMLATRGLPSAIQGSNDSCDSGSVWPAAALACVSSCAVRRGGGGGGGFRATTIAGTCTLGWRSCAFGPRQVAPSGAAFLIWAASGSGPRLGPLARPKNIWAARLAALARLWLPSRHGINGVVLHHSGVRMLQRSLSLACDLIYSCNFQRYHPPQRCR